MRALLLSGMGMSYKDTRYIGGSLLDDTVGAETASMLSRAGRAGLRLDQLAFVDAGRWRPLLRQPEATPHLTTFTLESILRTTRHEYTRIQLEAVWEGVAKAPDRDVDVVLLSTTYIWSRQMLAVVMAWLRTHVPGVPVVAGGQYTNLKYMPFMNEYPEGVAVVRGDAETSLPALLDAMQRRGDLAEVPNLVWRDGDRIRINAIRYIDLDEFPSPSFPGRFPIAPYESMRGCPFDCKFCSFPAASPKWRYKSAEKIRDDWAGYAEHNGVSVVAAEDSTFTVPPTRLRRLMEILPQADIPRWSCYSRANVITDAAFLDGLLAAHCFYLVIGFEAMNDETLRRMSKRVTVAQNLRALELLSASDMGYTNCFIVGYPGETPAQFDDTGRFLVEDYRGYFMLHRFSVSDDTMPLWEAREELRIEVEDPDDPESPWSHCGMSSEEARELQVDTLDRVRRTNDDAVFLLWQQDYQQPLLPEASTRTNQAVEKAVERLALAARDFSDVDAGADQIRRQLDRLRDLGVEPRPAPPDGAADRR